MAINWRRGAVFVAGLALGVAGTLVLFAPEGGDAQRPTSAASAPAASVPLPVVASAPRCETYSPIVAPRGEGDGELAMDKDVPASGSAVHNAIVQGKEAAASGKLRDAETAFLMACRSAEKLQDDPVALADAQYQLGRHYAQAAASANAARRDELMERAQALYATALAAYREHRGPDHEKTRFAAEGLAQLQQRMAGAGAAPPSGQEAAAKDAAAKEAAAKEAAAKEAAAKEAAAKEAAAKEAAAKEAAAQDETAAPARPERETRVAAAEPEPRRAASTRRTNPSFDCALARSTTERLICADEDLARQDRELGRLHQRAKEAAPDPRAFQRRSDAAWQRREDECRDRACLQRWYAQRRAELLSSLDTRASARSAPPPQPPAVIAPPPAPPSSPAVVAGTASGDAGVGGAIPQAEGSTGAD